MEKEQQKELAKQLRQPEGEYGVKVGQEMNKGNKLISINTYKLLQLKNKDRLLEIGPGNALFIKDHIFKNSPNIHYTGVDISDTMLDEAAKINQDLIEAKKATFIKANITNLPFEDVSFNKICTVNTFYFWEDHQKIIEELYRVLKPEGIAIIAVRPKSIMNNMDFTQFGFDVRSETEMKEICDSANWVKTEIIKQNEGIVKFAGLEINLSGEYFLLHK